MPINRSSSNPSSALSVSAQEIGKTSVIDGDCSTKASEPGFEQYRIDVNGRIIDPAS